MDPLLGPVLIRDADLAEIVLRKLAGLPLETHQRRDGTRPQRLRTRIQCAVPAGIPLETRPMEQLDGPQRWVLGQRCDYDCAIRVRLRWRADPPPRALRRVIDGCDPFF